MSGGSWDAAALSDGEIALLERVAGADDADGSCGDHAAITHLHDASLPGRARSLRRLLIAVDASLIGITLVAFALFVAPEEDLVWVELPLFSGMTMAALASRGLYRPQITWVRTVEFTRILNACVLAFVVGVTISQVLGTGLALTNAITRSVVLALALIVARTGYHVWLDAARRRGRYACDVIVIGTNDEACDIVELITLSPQLGLNVVGMTGNQTHCVEAPGMPAVLGPVSETAEHLRAVGAQGVVIASSAVNTDELNQVVRDVLRGRAHVYLSSGLQGIHHRRITPHQIGHESFLYLEQPKLTMTQIVTKRVLDIVISILGLLVTLPVLLLAAIAIKLQDGGSVLFRQVRVGRDGNPFRITKFRTMTPNAESLAVDLRERNERSGPLFKLADDPRRTKVGRLLEATSIDELPQLFDVLRGKMSLVGPRPALPLEVEMFSERLRSRHSVPPGITGLWQVEARDNPSFTLYEKLDLFYVENWSVTLDLAILAATIKAVAARGFRAVAKRMDSPRPVKAAAHAPAPADAA